MGLGQYLLIPFLGGYSHPFTGYFDANYRGTIGFDTLPYTAINIQHGHHAPGQVRQVLALDALVPRRRRKMWQVGPLWRQQMGGNP